MGVMICLHCGRSIPYGAESCPFCKTDTEYSQRYSRVPAEVPYSPSHPLPAGETADVPELSSKTRNTVIQRVLAHLYNNRKRGRKNHGK